MSEHGEPVASARMTAVWDSGSNEDFYNYYARQSRAATTQQRFLAVRDMLLRLGGSSLAGRILDVLDLGCGAGAQAQIWAASGHRYRGVDVNEPLVELARRRAAEIGSTARFVVGSATDLPCSDDEIDICLVAELLEHVADWQRCLDEAIRVLRPGGLLYISTSNVLCPRQKEFHLPLYSWYPAPLKRYFATRAAGDWPAVANFAKYPALNWFSFYALRDYLQTKGFSCLDRFDVMDGRRRGPLVRTALGAIRRLRPLRFIAHVCTSYTVVVARKD